jgi:hypothetical protein
MIISRLKKSIKKFTEAILTIFLVLVFFSMFLFVLNALFPSGTGLYSIISFDGSSSRTGLLKQAIRKLLLVQGEQETDPDTGETLAATLNSVHNHVKSKRARSIAWRKAKEKMPLYDRDSIQTFSRSSAEIQFDKNYLLQMRERSIVVIRQLANDLLLGEKRSVVVLVDGELRGKITGSGQKPLYMEVATPSATIRSQARQKTNEEIEFKITVNPDKSSTITVYQGKAEVLSGGKKVVVESNQATLVPLYQVPFKPVPLPQTVTLKFPEDSRKYFYQKLPPKIRFTWDYQPESKGYQFVLARDYSFRNIVTDESLVKPGLVHGNLKKGIYFWKVKTQGQYGDGLFSDIRRFEVVKDHTPPMLSVQFPSAIVTSDSCTVQGKTEPGANVFVDGNPVKTSVGGEFRHKLKLQRGINVIVVEAVDLADNVEYRSQLIHGKF